jgi:hypothetical protein
MTLRKFNRLAVNCNNWGYQISATFAISFMISIALIKLGNWNDLTILPSFNSQATLPNSTIALYRGPLQ